MRTAAAAAYFQPHPQQHYRSSFHIRRAAISTRSMSTNGAQLAHLVVCCSMALFRFTSASAFASRPFEIHTTKLN